jgi:LAO/AO transport system kinase
VLAVSAVTSKGLDEAWSTIERHQTLLTGAGEKARRRSAQAQAALWADLGDGMIEALRRRPAIAGRIPEIEAAVANGTMTAMAGARRLLALFLGE